MEFRGYEADAAKAGAGEPLASPGSMDAGESADLHDRAARHEMLYELHLAPPLGRLQHGRVADSRNAASLT
jgi:hypothetical protein